MDDARYEVVYIDKFTDMAKAEVARRALQKRFKMSDHVLKCLSLGKPVVIKKGLCFEEAERYERAVKSSGCLCWIQKMAMDFEHHERRLHTRRNNPERRKARRYSAIQPDRRMNLGRRSEDKKVLP